MSSRTKIEWTRGGDGAPGATWNPVTGCTKLSPASPGCENCYASTIAERFRGVPGHYFEHGFDVQLRADKLDLPLRWRRPRRIFVNSMSDLFHDQVPDDYIARIWAVMALAPQHTFQVLTKRHARMRSLLSSREFALKVFKTATTDLDFGVIGCHFDQPLPNVWLGVSTETQQWADIRIPALLDTPAAVRWISAEPLLGPIDLRHMDLDVRDMYQIDALTGRNTDMGRPCPDVASLDWVVAGGESGHGARPMHPDWARSLRDQCQAAGVPFFFKQWGAWVPGFSHGAGENGPGDLFVNLDGSTGHVWIDEEDCSVRNSCGNWGVASHPMSRCGKKAAGRELDGRIWDQYPRAVSAR